MLQQNNLNQEQLDAINNVRASIIEAMKVNAETVALTGILNELYAQSQNGSEELKAKREAVLNSLFTEEEIAGVDSPIPHIEIEEEEDEVLDNDKYMSMTKEELQEEISRLHKENRLSGYQNSEHYEGEIGKIKQMFNKVAGVDYGSYVDKCRNTTGDFVIGTGNVLEDIVVSAVDTVESVIVDQLIPLTQTVVETSAGVVRTTAQFGGDAIRSVGNQIKSPAERKALELLRNRRK